jgi:hypothetical protein
MTVLRDVSPFCEDGIFPNGLLFDGDAVSFVFAPIFDIAIGLADFTAISGVMKA